jgi:hypothetical protein
MGSSVFRDLLAGMLLGMILILAALSGLGVLKVDRRPIVLHPVIDLRPTPTPTTVPLTEEEDREVWRDFLNAYPKES